MRSILSKLIPGILVFGGFIATMEEKSFSADTKNGKANDGVVNNWDKPKNFSIGKINSYWIWFDDGEWHFRTTGGGKGAHHFAGEIEVVGGQFNQIKGLKGEKGGKLEDKFTFNGKKTSIKFNFKTDEGVDGIDFTVNNAADKLKFNLSMDGKSIPGNIRIGKDGDHPPDGTFTTSAHPKDQPNTPNKKKDKDKDKKKDNDKKKN